MPGLGISFGRGGATTFQQDLQNADCIVIEGSNFAECHPVGFRWVMEAKRRGATIIHVDPRFTRTSAMADLHVPIRSGSDVVFLGGLINYVLTHEKYFREYVVAYTNAATILREDFRDVDELDGLFSGWQPDQGKYDIRTWQYDKVEDIVPAAGHKHLFASAGAGHQQQQGGHLADAEHDSTLTHPRCVLQVLKRHFARYTPELVEDLCGVPPALFEKVARAITESSGRDRTTAFAYSVGWTQHSIGVQYIRTAAILQLLLGNIGRPGGGIMALRGHASIQGSTDIPTLYDLLPGYIPMPHEENGRSFDDWIASNRSQSGFWSELPKYAVSLMKAYWGEAATRETDWGFDFLPRLTGNHSHMTTVADMAEGKLRGYFVMGENPAVGSAHGGLQRKGLRNLEWLVVRDLAMTETAEFWRVAPEIEAGDVHPEDIATEVFFFPAAAHTEKEGSFTNTQRLLQWRHQAVEPPGDCRSELHFMYHLGVRLKRLYANSAERKDRAIQAVTWDYPTSGERAEPSAEAVLKEINGFTTSDGKAVDQYLELKDDGSTACGCWIYAGCYAKDENQTARRKPRTEQSWVAPEWGWAWPANRRLLYNRASADPEGRPWSERKKLVYWDEAQKKWTGADVPDFIVDRPPTHRPPKDARGIDALSGIDPFIMQADGKGWLFAPSGMLDGPMPSHYEPEESAIENPLYRQQCNPARLEWNRRDNRYHRAWGDAAYPFVLTTYRLTEHHTAGGMSRWLTWLSELQPELFCEVSPELAQERNLTHGGWATIRTARGELEARVMVTARMRPLRIRKRMLHQIGIPYHFGAVGLVRGDSTNDLLAFVADPNVNIPESKVLTADIVPGRRSRKRRLAAKVEGTLGASDPARDQTNVGPVHPEPTQMDSKS